MDCFPIMTYVSLCLQIGSTDKICRDNKTYPPGIDRSFVEVSYFYCLHLIGLQPWKLNLIHKMPVLLF
jgi:hypothetical protein